MAIVTRAGKGTPLTWNEVDNNFEELDKTFSNGLTETDGDIKLGGDYDEPFVVGDPTDKTKLSFGTIEGEGDPVSFFSYGLPFSADSVGLFLGSSAVTGKSAGLLLIDNDEPIGINVNTGTGAKLVDSIFNKGLTENADYSANKTEFSYVTLKMLDDKTSLTSPDGSIWDIQNDGTFVKRI